jgi:MoxR-like ATPase
VTIGINKDDPTGGIRPVEVIEGGPSKSGAVELEVPFGTTQGEGGRVTDAGVARHVIGLLRGAGTQRTAFAGRVQLGGVDPAKIYKSYYPNLILLDAFGKRPENEADIAAFLNHDVSVPPDLRASLTGAFSVRSQKIEVETPLLRAEPKAKLGGVQDPSVWVRAIQNADADGMKLDDDAVKDFWKWANEGEKHFQYLDRFIDNSDMRGGSRIAAIRLYARVNEIKASVLPALMPDRPRVAGLLTGLPDTDQAAAALLRFVASTGSAPEDVPQLMPFFNKHGYDTKRAIAEASVAGSKVGDLDLSLLQRRDYLGLGLVGLARQSDPSIHAMFGDSVSGQREKFTYDFVGRASPEFVVGMIHLIGRAAEINALPEFDPARFQQSVFARLTDLDPDMVRFAALGARRIAAARRVEESKFSIGGRSIGEILDGAAAARSNPIPQRGKNDPQRAKVLAELDPANARSSKQRQDAVISLLSKNEFSDLIDDGVRARTTGKLAPVAFTDAEALIGTWSHAAVASILAGLYAEVPEAALAQAFGKRGLRPEQYQPWIEVAARLSRMGPESLAFVFAEGWDLDAIRLRSELAQDRLDERGIERTFASHEKELPGFVRALMERMRSEPKDAGLHQSALEVLTSWRQQKKLDWDGIKSELGETAFALHDAVVQTVQPFVDAVREDHAAIPELDSAVARYGAFAKPGFLRELLRGFHSDDLRERIGLREADELGGKVGPLRPEADALANDPSKVVVEGIPLAKWTGKRTSSVPSIPKIVLTPTTKRLLRIAAGAWAANLPTKFKGPTSQGKTTLVRYLCAVTETPYNRIVCSQSTTPEDLIGRWVGGEHRFDRAALKAKGTDELAALEQEYGLEDEKLHKDALIERLLVVQEEPRFVYGRLVKGLMRGECVVLDEYYNLRDAVKEALNGLFDDDGNLVIEDNEGEVIRPKPGARVFATTNDVDEVGRTAGARSTKSRWVDVAVDGLEQTDIAMIAKELYGERIPEATLVSLVNAHCALDGLAEKGELNGGGGKIAFTLRNLFKVAERVIRYRGGELDDQALLRREMEEVYLGAVTNPEELQAAHDQLQPIVGELDKSTYKNLTVEFSELGFSIGDVFIPNHAIDHPRVPKKKFRLTMTPRVAEAFYKLCKTMDMGEHAMLVGGAASGKTLMARFFAQISGQPLYEQQFTDKTSNRRLIGKYTPKGWIDGPFLRACRPAPNPPGVFIANEYNMAPPPVAERLNSALDDERRMTLVEYEGKEFDLHPDFRFIGTMNESGAGYSQRYQLSRAAKNRLTFIHVPELEDPKEMRIIATDLAPHLGVQVGIAETFVEFQEWLASAYANGDVGSHLTDQQKPELSMRQIVHAMTHVGANGKALGDVDSFLLATETVYGGYKQDRPTIMAEATRRTL